MLSSQRAAGDRPLFTNGLLLRDSCPSQGSLAQKHVLMLYNASPVHIQFMDVERFADRAYCRGHTCFLTCPNHL